MSNLSIHVRRGAIDARYGIADSQLRGAGRWSLIEWEAEPAPVDNEVPLPVARVLAGALASVARATYLRSDLTVPWVDGWTTVSGGQVLMSQPRKLAALAGEWLGARPRHIALFSSTQENALLPLFSDAGFAWWRQAQVVVLSAADAPPPAVCVERALELISAGELDDPPSLRALGVQALLRPGADGDMAGFLALASDTDERFVAALSARALRDGVRFSVD